ncbi:MAG: hypothetical protein H8D63_01750 [Parcubacteria group bacterium]|nr:hypothetical protein [Parcubacteria group bacterium]
MDIVLFIAFITAFACVGVCAALFYRGWELSREDMPEHIHTHRVVRTYAEDSVDRMVTVLRVGIARMWRSQIVPMGTRVKKYVVQVAANFAPTAYLIRVYRAIRGLHATQGEEEDKSSFLQEVNAHKSTSETRDFSVDAQEPAPDTEKTKTPM